VKLSDLVENLETDLKKVKKAFNEMVEVNQKLRAEIAEKDALIARLTATERKDSDDERDSVDVPE
jgi:regulator of replication initiation timing